MRGPLPQNQRPRPSIARRSIDGSTRPCDNKKGITAKPGQHFVPTDGPDVNPPAPTGLPCAIGTPFGVPGSILGDALTSVKQVLVPSVTAANALRGGVSATRRGDAAARPRRLNRVALIYALCGLHSEQYDFCPSSIVTGCVGTANTG
jgi:hypothetical protein